LPAAQAQPAPTTPGRVVLTEGHIDAVAPRVLDGKLQIQVKDGTTIGDELPQQRGDQPAQAAQRPKISNEWPTSVKPCSAAILSAHLSTVGPVTSTVRPQLRHTRWWW
jgi:hypothetical protein